MVVGEITLTLHLGIQGQTNEKRKTSLHQKLTLKSYI